jgi:hypothetical protein
MVNTIQIKRSNVAGKVPTPAALEVGELALNFPDKKLYTKEPGGTIVELAPADPLLRIIDVNDAIPGLRITQTGAGPALLVEDEANPDATPFVVDTSGNVGVGISTPGYKVHINGASVNQDGTVIMMNSPVAASNVALAGTISDSSYVIYTNNIERLRVEKDGYVGIGLTAPAVPEAMLQINCRGGWTANNYGKGLFVTSKGLANPAIGISDANGINNIAFANTNGRLTVAHMPAVADSTTAPIERMVIEVNGNVGIGNTFASGSPPGSPLEVAGYIAGHRYVGRNATTYGSGFSIYWTGTAGQLWIDGANVGNISTASDYRVKKDVATMTGDAVQRIMKIRPVTYQFGDYGAIYKADGVVREGFIAHELQAIIPSAVEGAKDDPEQIQSLKIDALCAVLVKAVQEQQGIIENLKARIEALEARP